LSAFGDERVLPGKISRTVLGTRIQVFADRQGGCLSLFERDCSMQRRHQKVLEEAPAPGNDRRAPRRDEKAALAAAKPSATSAREPFEFLVDRAGAFYFMEMKRGSGRAPGHE